MNIIDLLGFSVKNRATHLYLASGLAPRVRIAGKIRALEDLPPLDPEEVEELIRSAMDREQYLKYTARSSAEFIYKVHELGRFYVNAFMHSEGISATFRTLPDRVLSLGELQTPLTVFEKIASLRHGLVLVVNDPSNFRFTCMALIDYINATSYKHIQTLESPIEFILEKKKSFIQQTQIADSQELSESLRLLLGQHPDVLLLAPRLGEMDPEAIRLMMLAAETGHLVFVATHATSAAQAVGRMLSAFSGGEREVIRGRVANCLQAVICQSVINKAEERHYAYEVMLGTPAIRGLIESDKLSGLQAEIESGNSVGMRSLEQDLVELVDKGLISEEEAFTKMRGNTSGDGVLSQEDSPQSWYLKAHKRFMGDKGSAYEHIHDALQRFRHAVGSAAQARRGMNFLPPDKLASTALEGAVLGVDIGTYEVKVIELAKEQDGFKILHYACCRVPQGAVKENDLVDVDAVARTLEKAVRQSGAQGKYGAFALSRFEAIAERFAVDGPLEDVGIDEISAWGKQYIPHPLDRVHLDFQVDATATAAHQVLLAAVHKEPVGRWVHALELGGVTPVLIDLDEFALENLVPLLGGADQQAGVVALVDIGFEFSSLMVFKDSHSVYARNTRFGGEQLKQAVREHFQVEAEEAWQMLLQEQAPQPLEECKQEWITQCAQMVARHLHWFAGSVPDIHVQQVYLCGRFASMIGLSTSVSNEITLPVALIDLSRFASSGPEVDAAQLVADSPRLFKACALALRRWKA